MAWGKAGFKPGMYGWGNNSGNGGNVQTPPVMKVNQSPTTDDYITWRLPTTTPIVNGSLVVILNGMIQSLDEFEELSDGLGFVWKSPEPIDSGDVLRTMFMV